MQHSAKVGKSFKKPSTYKDTYNGKFFISYIGIILIKLLCI